MTTNVDDRYTDNIPGQPREPTESSMSTARVAWDPFPTIPPIYKVQDTCAELSLENNLRTIMKPPVTSLVYRNTNVASNDCLGAAVTDDEQTVFNNVIVNCCPKRTADRSRAGCFCLY